MRRSFVSFDHAIKAQLRNKANYDVVSGFLSELFGRDVKIQEMIESENNKKRKEDKTNRVDIIAKETDGSKVIIELQFNHEIDFFQRMLFETSTAVVENLNEGDEYGKIDKIYSVNIMYFKLGVGRDYIYHGTTTFKGLHSKDVLKLTEKQQIEYMGKKFPSDVYPEYYILNLSAFNDKIRDNLDEWVEYLKTDKMPEKPKAKGLAKAKKVLDYYKMTLVEQKEYDKEIDRRRSLRSMFKTARIEGLSDGREEGRADGLAEGIAVGKAEGIAVGKAEGIAVGKAEGELIGEKKAKMELAKKMKLAKEDVKKIILYTGLTEKEIKELK
ncbi:hypothetical protein AGMMS49938_09550 [Fibrobacterales bacterium]|nr:hypothetical protein AGMMS49938_09550 [Fibrobacterales bacterium]